MTEEEKKAHYESKRQYAKDRRDNIASAKERNMKKWMSRVRVNF